LASKQAMASAAERYQVGFVVRAAMNARFQVMVVEIALVTGCGDLTVRKRMFGGAADRPN